MTQEFLAHAFDVFAQAEARSGGLGLGLPLSRRLAELHGGTLVAESEGIGRGSVLTLVLPLLPLPPDAEATDPPSPPGAAASRRVLVVEDNEDLAWSMEALLQSLGHHVRRVGTGGAALAVAPDYHPDVVLLDIGLPDMSGTEVAAKLREMLGQSPVLAAMTGFGQEDARQRSLASGCNHHLTKPVAVDDLQRLLAAGETPSS